MDELNVWRNYKSRQAKTGHYSWAELLAMAVLEAAAFPRGSKGGDDARKKIRALTLRDVEQPQKKQRRIQTSLFQI
jgi:hypothetical protein